MLEVLLYKNTEIEYVNKRINDRRTNWNCKAWKHKWRDLKYQFFIIWVPNSQTITNTAILIV
jgi:hypothetical protein